MAEQLPRGLLADPAVQRAMLLPIASRTYTDPGDDITEEPGGLEFALPGLLYDPMLGAAQTGAMLMGRMPVNPDVVTQTLLDTSVGSGLLGAATGMAPKGAVLGANVFHGGPHRFAPEPDFPHGRPRLDKIGTGEGHQAYGYGFYSADAPGVATAYREGVIDMGEVHRLNDEMSNLAKVMDQDSGPGYRNFISDKGREAAQRYDELMAARQAVVSAPGTLYKLDIPDADVAKYLDYDKPLSEQPKSVRDALKAYGNFPDNMTGSQVYESIASMLAKPPFDSSMPSTKNPSAAQAASEALRKAGIPGLKYRDQMSRYDPDILPDNMIANEARKWLGQSDGDSEKAMKLFKDSNPRELYADREINEIEKVINTAGRKITRNYVTWDQDVLDRSKMLERDGVTLGANKAPTAALPGLLDDVGINTTQRGNVLEITKIETPDNLRGRGLADQRLEQLIQQADADGTTLALTPSNAFGANKSRLTKWYKRHGFVPNKGRNKDFTTRESMVRPPRNIELGANKAPTAALPGLLQDRRRKPGRTPRNQNSFPMRSLLGQRLYTATMPDGSI